MADLISFAAIVVVPPVALIFASIWQAHRDQQIEDQSWSSPRNSTVSKPGRAA